MQWKAASKTNRKNDDTPLCFTPQKQANARLTPKRGQKWGAFWQSLICHRFRFCKERSEKETEIQNIERKTEMDGGREKRETEGKRFGEKKKQQKGMQENEVWIWFVCTRPQICTRLVKWGPEFHKTDRSTRDAFVPILTAFSWRFPANQRGALRNRANRDTGLISNVVCSSFGAWSQTYTWFAAIKYLDGGKAYKNCVFHNGSDRRGYTHVPKSTFLWCRVGFWFTMHRAFRLWRHIQESPVVTSGMISKFQCFGVCSIFENRNRCDFSLSCLCLVWQSFHTQVLFLSIWEVFQQQEQDTPLCATTVSVFTPWCIKVHKNLILHACNFVCFRVKSKRLKTTSLYRNDLRRCTGDTFENLWWSSKGGSPQTHFVAYRQVMRMGAGHHAAVLTQERHAVPGKSDGMVVGSTNPCTGASFGLGAQTLWGGPSCMSLLWLFSSDTWADKENEFPN